MFCIAVDTLLTRMHSSRLRTVLYSGRLGGGRRSAGGGCLPWGLSAGGLSARGGVCLPGGCTVLPEGCLPEGCLPGGLPRGCIPRGCLARGMSA